jgi:hypothetical protein
MSWSTNKSIIKSFIGLVFLSALFSCEDPSTLGIDLIGNNDDLAVLFTEIPLTADVVRFDSINTTGRGFMMTGNHTDSDFGNLDVQSYIRIVPPAASPNIPESVLEADSVKMDLRFNYYFGESPVTHHLMAHELSEQVDPERIYYSFDSTPFMPTSLIDSTFTVTDQDTLLSLNLNPLKDKLFQAMQEYEADSAGSAEFLQEFNGITLISGSSSNAVLGFSNQSSDSKITLYYTTNDTIVNTIEFGYSTYYNRITPDYSGTELDGLEVLQDFSPASGNAYLQTGAGLIPKLNFEAFYDFVDNDTTGSIVINQAILVMDNLQGVEGAINPPQQMSFYYTNEANELVLVGTENIKFPASIQTDAVYINASRNNLDPFNTSLRSVRAELDTANVNYRPEITLFLQFIADGAFDRNATDRAFSMPFSFVEAPNTVQEIGRNVDRFMLTPDNLRLEIFYTRLR